MWPEHEDERNGENAGVDLAHSIGPGSSGPKVRAFASMLEKLGVRTYISTGSNPEDVFDDALLQQARDALVEHADVDKKAAYDVDAIHGEEWDAIAKAAAHA